MLKNTVQKNEQGKNKKTPKIQLKQIPIKQASAEAQKPFIAKADKMLALHKNLQEKTGKFIKRIKSNLEIEKIS